MKKILVLVRGYYPEISASGNLMRHLIEELGKENKVFILSCASDNKAGSLSNNIKYQKIKIRDQSSNILKRLTLFLKKKIIISYHNNEIVSSFLREIEKLDGEKNFDIILAITYEEILALLRLNIPIKKKCVFLLEKLPITSNIPLLSTFKSLYRKRIEKEILLGVSKVYALPIIYNYFKKTYGGYSGELVQLEHPMITNRVSVVQNKSSVINLIYAGGLDRKQRNPSKLIKLFNEVNKKINIKLVIYSYGNTQKMLKTLSEEKQFLVVSDAISPVLLEKEVNMANFIITIGNKETDIVPSKIFDCISTGKPIIHFSQIDADPYYEYLKRYPNSLIIEYNKKIMDNDISKIVKFLKRNKETTVEFEKIEKKFLECTPSYIAREITRS